MSGGYFTVQTKMTSACQWITQEDYDPVREKQLKDPEANYKEATQTTIHFFNFSVNLLLKAIVLPALFLLILFTLGRGVAGALGGRLMPVPDFEV